MTYLIDTNVILEILLEQENYEAALSFIRNNKELYMSDFSLHSIGVILVRLEKPDVFSRRYGYFRLYRYKEAVSGGSA